MLGSGGGDVNVPCTCTHVGCYARCWVGVGGMLTFLLINDQIWEYLYSWQWRQNAGKDLWANMQEVFAEWKKKTPLIRYSNSSAPLTRAPPCLLLFIQLFWLNCQFWWTFWKEFVEKKQLDISGFKIEAKPQINILPFPDFKAVPKIIETYSEGKLKSTS